ncbi:MAG: hypothetical protein JEZ01_04295 [Labilibaculum sp.]|nr:hypothetical protein [Labilibaculum sp.]MBI9056972.1 hypothetical protein [Labilibaculum sp.]
MFEIKLYSFLIVMVLFASCRGNSNSEGNLNDFIVVKQKNNESGDSREYSKENYRQEVEKIIKEGKESLRKVLPKIIEDQFKLYKNTLDELEAANVMSINQTIADKRILEINVNTGVQLLDDELYVNEIYYNIIGKLALLNDDYYNHYLIENDVEINFHDFYDIKPFVLAEEVSFKIDEFVKDEKCRSAKESKDLKFGVGITLIQLIPGASAVTKITESIVKTARTIKKGADLAKNAGFVQKFAAKVMGQKTAIKLARGLSNSVKRNRVSKRVALVGGAGVAVEAGYNFKQYRNIENKLKGRIGDFSDGMIAVHIQMLREISKLNIEAIYTLKK